jgi:hypothetical protein
MLLGSILGSIVPVVHMLGKGLGGGSVAGTDGMPLWVFTLLLGVTSAVSGALSARGLWSSLRRQPQ